MSFSSLLYDLLSPINHKKGGLYEVHSNVKTTDLVPNFNFHHIKFENVKFSKNMPKGFRDRITVTRYTDTSKAPKYEVTRYAMILNADHLTVLVPTMKPTLITRFKNRNVSEENKSKFNVPTNLALLIEVKLTLGDLTIDERTGLYKNVTESDMKLILA